MEPWVWALVVSIAGALVGIIYWAGQSRDDKQDARAERNEKALAEHIRDDIGAHERIKALEIKVDNHDREIASIRERWHDLRSEISTTLGNWYVNIVKMIGKQ
jgi:hypothetical protein